MVGTLLSMEALNASQEGAVKEEGTIVGSVLPTSVDSEKKKVHLLYPGHMHPGNMLRFI